MSAVELILIIIVTIGALGFFSRATAPRRGCGVNDLSRWKQYGGHLERPAPPRPNSSDHRSAA